MIKKICKLLLALLLAPTVLLVTIEAAKAFINVIKDFQVTVGLLAGAALYCVIHFGGYKFERMYVWAHEFTHAIAAVLCGFRVHSITVKKDSGNVKMDRCNCLVVLAPYFVPLYALCVGLIYMGMDIFTDATPYRAAFVFAIGFFMAFHFVQTFQTLWETDQPDLQVAGGRIFSLVFILLCNAIIFVLVLKCLFPQTVVLKQMMYQVTDGTLRIWKIIAGHLVTWFKTTPAR